MNNNKNKNEETISDAATFYQTSYLNFYGASLNNVTEIELGTFEITRQMLFLGKLCIIRKTYIICFKFLSSSHSEYFADLKDERKISKYSKYNGNDRCEIQLTTIIEQNFLRNKII